jgi:outer membrane protein assembly factor BamB
VYAAPAVAGDLVFIGSCAGAFYALDLETGEPRWSHDVSPDGGMSFHGGLLLRGEEVFVGTDGTKGWVYAFRWKTGDLLWKVQAGRSADTDLVSSGSRLYVVVRGREEGGYLAALDLESGREVWRADLGAAVGPPYVINRSPALAGDAVYFGGSDGMLHAFDADTGESRYAREVGAPVITSITARNGALFYGTDSGHLLRSEPRSGEVERRFDLAGRPHGPPVPWRESLFLHVGWMRRSGRLVSVETSLGSEVWSLEAPDTTWWTAARPCVLDDLVLTGNDRGTVFACDARDGSVAWTLDLDGAIRVLAPAGDRLLVGTIEGMVHCLVRKGGRPGASPRSGGDGGRLDRSP